MAEFAYKNEIIDNYVSEFTSRIVSESGIPSDKYHLGKIILQSFKDDPDFVMQIDGGTGESETNRSMLRRSIQCATSFKNMGLKTGDAIVLMAPNHLDQAVPFYAALYLGVAIAPIDRTLGVNELKDTLNISKPKIIFCQSEKVQDVQKAVHLKKSCVDSKIISFDGSPDTMTFSEMIETHSDQTITVENFKAIQDNNPEATAEVLTKDGWFKTGDMLHRDENWNFYYVERIKLLLKYKSQKVSPVELEGVIRQHPGVLDVAVTSLFEAESGELPVACVVRRPGCKVTADEIKDLVKEKLADSKQLRGGVFFLKELPLNTSTKVHRRKLKEIVIAMTTVQAAI